MGNIERICYWMTLLSVLSLAFSTYTPCIHKDFGHGSDVCVCNATYCDEFIALPPIKSKQCITYTSSKYGLRFNASVHDFKSNANVQHEMVDLKLSVNASKTFQAIHGFGGAFTGNKNQ